MEVASGDAAETGSEESPSSESAEAGVKPESEEEEEPPTTLFTLHLVNSYGNAQIGPLEGEEEGDSTIRLTSKNYLSLDWHPRAKQKFFNEKAAEDFTQDDSWNGKVAPKKQVISLSECL